VTSSAGVELAAPRGTAFQRGRATLVGAAGALLGHLPAGVVDGLCDSVGELWYRAAPGRAAVARGNLAHVVATLAAEGRGSARARAAADDPAALERLVRASFRHAVRTYAETLRGEATARDVRRRLVIETAEAVDEAFAAGGPAVFAALHLGSMAAVTTVIGDRSRAPVTAPMETLGDPEMQRVIKRTRESGGARIIGLAEARRELRAALARGEVVGIIGDRDVAGGGLRTPLFGLPASLPMGPPYLAIEARAPLHVAAVHRVPGGGFRGRLVTVPHPPTDLPRRARIEALLAAQAAAFEDLVAAAPEQWSTVFHPIWDTVGPRGR
jgi:KDO2-lipid IV(A) lauroyltransferase